MSAKPDYATAFQIVAESVGLPFASIPEVIARVRELAAKEVKP